MPTSNKQAWFKCLILIEKGFIAVPPNFLNQRSVLKVKEEALAKSGSFETCFKAKAGS